VVWGGEGQEQGHVVEVVGGFKMPKQQMQGQLLGSHEPMTDSCASASACVRAPYAAAGPGNSAPLAAGGALQSTACAGSCPALLPTCQSSNLRPLPPDNSHHTEPAGPQELEASRHHGADCCRICVCARRWRSTMRKSSCGHKLTRSSPPCTRCTALRAPAA
jgi:hypothetical protein